MDQDASQKITDDHPCIRAKADRRELHQVTPTPKMSSNDGDQTGSAEVEAAAVMGDTSGKGTTIKAFMQTDADAVNVGIHNRLPANHLLNCTMKNRIISKSIDIHGHDNFPMGCAFSPDGTCVLTATAHDGKFRLYDTPFQYLTDGDTNNTGVDNDNAVVDDDHDEIGGNSGVISTSRPQHEEGDAETETTTATYSHNQNYQPSSLKASNETSEKGEQNNQQNSTHPHPWKASLTSHQGGPPPSSSSASYAWYPLMTSSSPLTSLYVTCRGHSMPIHLIDAYTSQLRATYRPYNGVDEMEGPTVVEFSPDGRRIYGTGFKSDRTIAVFDTSIPGRDGMIARLGKTRRSHDGQKGIPSAISFPKCSNNSDGSSSGCSGPSNVFAVGTYSPASIYIYDDRMSTQFNPAGTIVLHGGLTVVGHGRAFSRKKRRYEQVDSKNQDGNSNEGEENLFSLARVSWFQSRARGGVTQLMWAPPTSNNPFMLFSASRRSNTVLSWDVRCLSGGDSSKTGRPVCGLQSYARDGDTNQRLEFDLDSHGRRIFVGSGSSEGVVKIYDVNSGKLEDTLDVASRNGECKDAVNGVSYFDYSNGYGKYNDLLAVAVGSRQFYEEESDNEDGGSSVFDRTPGFVQLHALKA